MTADKLAQTPTHTISHHGAAKPARGNKASAKWTYVFDVQHAEHQNLSVLQKTLAFYPFEFSSARQSAIFGKREGRSWHGDFRSSDALFGKPQPVRAGLA
jgi:hypothetical protein